MLNSLLPKHSLTIILGLLSILFFRDTALAGDMSLEEFKSQVDFWRQNVAFTSHCEIWQGSIPKEVADELLLIFPEISVQELASYDIHRHAKGLLHVRREAVRFRLDFTDNNVLVEESQLKTGKLPQGAIAVQNSPFDSILGPPPNIGRPINVELAIPHQREAHKFGNSLRVYSDDSVTRRPARYSAYLTPLTWCTPAMGSSPWMVSGTDVTTTIQRTGNDDRYSLFIKNENKDSTAEHVYKFDLPNGLISLKERVSTWTSSDGLISKSVELHSDLVDCGDPIFVPRKVILILHNSKSPLALVKVFYSADLGQRTPTNDDFVMEISPTTRVSGLGWLPEITKQGTREISFYDLEKSSLQAENVINPVNGQYIESRPPDHIPQAYWGPLFYFNLFFILALAGIAMTRNFR